MLSADKKCLGLNEIAIYLYVCTYVYLSNMETLYSISLILDNTKLTFREKEIIYPKQIFYN